MRIRRSRPTKDFVQVPNATARDDRLSHMARGILVEILSHHVARDVTADEMWRQSVATHGKDSPGRRAFRSAFAELKTYGYIRSSREATSGGRYGTVLTLSDVPHAGTSVPPGETDKTAGRADVPHAGTSAEAPTDVPHGGTSESPGQTALFAGGTDVPLSDVPHAGTSNRKRTGSNTSEKTSPAEADAAAVIADGIPDAARPLVDALTAEGVIVRWPFRGNEWFPVLALITDKGIPAMTTAARRIYAKYDPERASYFMPAWGELPPLLAANATRPKLRAVAGGHQPHRDLEPAAYETPGEF